MKKLILLGLATMITFSASAQIEMYKEEQQVQVKEKSWQKKKKEYLATLQQNTTYPLLSLSPDVDYKDKDINRYLIGDTLYSVRDSLMRSPIFVLTSTNDSIRVSQLPIGEYFQVVDMIVCKEEKDSLFNSFNNKTFVKEKVTVGGISYKFRKMRRKTPIWEYLYKNIYPIYVLKKNDTIYYASYEGYYHKKDHVYFWYPDYDRIYMADISDFVSVKSYNMLKRTFMGKDLVYIPWTYRKTEAEFIEEVEESSIWTIKNLLVKGADFYVECVSNDGEKIEDIIYGKCEYDKVKYYTNGTDTVRVLPIEERRGFILKSEADVLIAKFKYEEEQKALAEKKQQTQHKNDIIKKYGEKYGSLILQGKICVGMTQEMCIEAKGTPCKKNKSSDKYGTIEVWTYNCLGVEWAWKSGLSANYTFVTFKNGKITDITE